MSLYPDIKFNSNLIENEVCTITYSGTLFKNNSESVTIVYGYNDQWENTTHQEMQKTENGFTTDITILNYNNFNFCFKNSNNEWDNNNYQNYTSSISKQELEPAFIINENIIDNIIENIVKYDISTVKTETNEIEDVTTIETVVETNNEIIESTPTTESQVEQTAETQTSSIESFEINVENSEPIAIEESIGTIVEENSLNNDLEQAFSELYEENTEDVQASESTYVEETNESSDFNMNSLIDEILAPITESDNFEEQTYELSSVEFTDKTEDLEEDNAINEKIEDLITDLYDTAVEKNNLALNIESNSDNSSEKIIENLENSITISENITTEDTTTEIETITSTPEEISTENIFEEVTEDSLLTNIESLSEETQETETALVEIDNIDNYLVSSRSLSKFYMFRKKVKLAFYKIISLPKTLFSNFGKQNS